MTKPLSEMSLGELAQAAIRISNDLESIANTPEMSPLDWRDVRSLIGDRKAIRAEIERRKASAEITALHQELDRYAVDRD